MLIDKILKFENIIHNGPKGINDLLRLQNLKEDIKKDLFKIYDLQEDKQIWLTNEFKSLNNEMNVFDKEDDTFNIIYKKFIYRFDFIVDYLDKSKSKYDLALTFLNEFQVIKQYSLKVRIYKVIVSLIFYLVVNESLIDLLVVLINFYFEQEVEDRTIAFEIQTFLNSLDNNILTEIENKTTYMNTLLNIE